MASRQVTVDFIVEQMGAAGEVSARKMFGEYAIYCRGKLVALVCDDQLFVKATAAGRAKAAGVAEAPPYKSAKPCLLIPGDLWEDADWLSALARLTADELPMPRPKPPGKKARPRSR